jgi:hypothetical protein
VPEWLPTLLWQSLRNPVYIIGSHTPGPDLNGKIGAEVAGGEEKVKSEKEHMAPQRSKPYCFRYLEYI